jgi:putative ABC transport system permease protein
MGGTIGVLLGMAGTFVLSALTQWPTLFSVKAILLAFLFSGCVGVFFGFYPARKAALLNPIEALRYE